MPSFTELCTDRVLQGDVRLSRDITWIPEWDDMHLDLLSFNPVYAAAGRTRWESGMRGVSIKTENGRIRRNYEAVGA